MQTILKKQVLTLKISRGKKEKKVYIFHLSAHNVCAKPNVCYYVSQSQIFKKMAESINIHYFSISSFFDG